MTISAEVLAQLEDQAIELPSWAFGNSGTRFKVFTTAGTPRTIQEKITDAAKVNEVTGIAPSVALHIPWDRVEDRVRWTESLHTAKARQMRTTILPRVWPPSSAA